MDQAKKDALKNLDHMSGHLKFIPGVAASGKSTFLFNLFQLIFFRASGRETPAKDCEPSDTKVLYCR